MISNPELFRENIFRRCVGDRDTTRNTLDIKPGQIILVRRGLEDLEAALIVSLISQNTTSEITSFACSLDFKDRFIENLNTCS